MTKKLAVIYDRGSTTKQDNYARLNARESGVKIAEAHGYHWHYLKELKTGKTIAGRPVFRFILEQVERGRVKAIIVDALDRLARPKDANDLNRIKQACVGNDCLIITPRGVLDWDNEDDALVGDIQLAIAANERVKINRRTMSGKKAKAKQGGWLGGQVPLGYVIRYELTAGRPVSDLAIEPTESAIVRVLFDLYARLQSLRAIAREARREGYTGKRGQPLTANTIRKVLSNQMYIGFVSWGRTANSKHLKDYEPPIVYRQELQIIPTRLWERVQGILAKRTLPHRGNGVYGTHILTGFIACENCGGYCTSSRGDNGRVTYRCENYRQNRECTQGKTYSEHLILEPIITEAAAIINRVTLDRVLGEAAQEYRADDTAENKLKAELEQATQQVQRLAKAVSLGVFSNDEAREQLEPLRATQAKLKRQLNSLAHEGNIQQDILEAIEALRQADLRETLLNLEPVDLRSVLGMIFEPGSLSVKTYRKKGGYDWSGELVGYRLNSQFAKYVNCDPCQHTGCSSATISIKNQKRIKGNGHLMRFVWYK